MGAPETLDLATVYWLTDTGNRAALLVERKSARADEESAAASGERTPRRPWVYRRAQGARAFDLVMTTSLTLIVSPRFQAALEDAGASGWTTYPVRAHGKDDVVLEGYAGLAVTGRSGPLDHSRSSRRWFPPPAPGGAEAYGWVGLCFDPATWDGTDVFQPEGTELIFVRESVRTALESAGVRNVRFERITEVEQTTANVDGEIVYAPLRGGSAG